MCLQTHKEQFITCTSQFSVQIFAFGIINVFLKAFMLTVMCVCVCVLHIYIKFFLKPKHSTKKDESTALVKPEQPKFKK